MFDVTKPPPLKYSAWLTPPLAQDIVALLLHPTKPKQKAKIIYFLWGIWFMRFECFLLLLLLLKLHFYYPRLFKKTERRDRPKQKRRYNHISSNFKVNTNTDKHTYSHPYSPS